MNEDICLNKERLGQLELIIEHTINLAKNCPTPIIKTGYLVKLQEMSNEYKDITGKPYVAVQYRDQE